jgi:23S rRNA (uracil1939-C5)-methyltransferase
VKNKKKVFKIKRDEKVKTADVDVEEIVWGGKGLTRLNGKVFFISKAVPEERVKIRITLEKSDFGEGEIERIITPSKFRVSPLCKDFKRCGGCQLQMMNYPSQLLQKQKIAENILRRWKEFAKFNQIVGMENPFFYRHKGEFHLKVKDGKLVFGFYEKESHKIVDFENCYLFDDKFNLKLKEIVKFLNLTKGKNSLLNFSLSCSENGEDFVLTLSHKGSLNDENEIIEKLSPLNLKGIILENKESRSLRSVGECFITYSIKPSDEILKEIHFKVDPKSFTQANFEMNNRLINESLRLLNLSNYESILELFSGVGNFSLPISLRCKEILSIEGSEVASKDAKFNAIFNGLTNVENINGDVNEWVMKLLSQSRQFDVIFLDPPRSGSFEIMDLIARFQPKNILYVSCSLPTLERDLRRIYEFGYIPKEFSFFDMFPQTYGIETIALLERKK